MGVGWGSLGELEGSPARVGLDPDQLAHKPIVKYSRTFKLVIKVMKPSVG